MLPRRGTRRAAELAEAGPPRGFHVVGPKIFARRPLVWTEDLQMPPHLDRD
jgi:hypothetical protein